MLKRLFFPVITFAFLFVFQPVESAAQLTQKPYPNSKFDTIDGIMVHYRVWNEDVDQPTRKILFIHGFAGSTFCFRYLYDTLETLGYKVVAIDLPGAGYSDRTLDFNHSHSSRARFLWKFLSALEPEDTTGWQIVGHSMGGGAAEAMAIMEPERTDKLVLIAGTIFRKSNNMTGTVGFMIRQKKIKKFMVAYADRNVITYKRFSRMLKSAYKRKPDSTEVMGYLTPLEIEGSAAALINVYVNNKEIEKLDVRNLTEVPVMAIWGTKDSWVSLSTSRIYLSAFPDLELVKIKGAGHLTMETNLEEFLPPFLRFLE